MLVKQVDRAIVADQPLHHSIACGTRRFCPRQQPLGRCEAAEIGLLQPLVGKRLRQRRGFAAVASGQAFEEFCTFSEAAGIVADIGFAPDSPGVQRAGLDAGEARGVAYLGCRNLHRALLRPIGGDRRQRQL